MEVKLGSIPVQVGQDYTHHFLEVFHGDVRDPDSHVGYMIRLQVRQEGQASTWIPMILTPAGARALAALLCLPIQAP